VGPLGVDLGRSLIPKADAHGKFRYPGTPAAAVGRELSFDLPTSIAWEGAVLESNDTRARSRLGRAATIGAARVAPRGSFDVGRLERLHDTGERPINFVRRPEGACRPRRIEWIAVVRWLARCALSLAGGAGDRAWVKRQEVRRRCA
jgi:hypothetical protein